MAKLLAITDTNGDLLGVVRADPIRVNGVTIEAVPMETPKQKHYFVEVADNMLGKHGKHIEALHQHVKSLLPKR
jgi:hypothetical protein